MTETELAAGLREKLGDKVLELEQPSRNNIFVTIKPEDVVDVARTVWDGMQSRFAIITGIDVPGAIEMLYHFIFDEKQTVVTVKTRLGKPFPRVESVTPMIPAAEWIEREVHDLLGVDFRNHPNLKRLILSDDWPEGVYPLRKDFVPKDPNE
jgi:Ni,Fe-hydrogenase III component G